LREREREREKGGGLEEIPLEVPPETDSGSTHES
jgi:hypothetical protein